MKTVSRLVRRNGDLADRTWGELSSPLSQGLEELTERYGFSVALGDLQQIDGRWYVTHAALLRTAQRRRCHAILTSLQDGVSDPIARRWVFKATVYKTPSSRGFIGYGDADPTNVSALVRGAEMRMAETRAVSRALRKAYGIGLCSVEELGSFSGSARPSASSPLSNVTPQSVGSNTGQTRLRDQLCLLIRKYELDSDQVKRYAADFCGTSVLRDASRNLVESFITTLADQAANDRVGLICKLNGYGLVQAVKP
jgi:hypothetical protein